MPPSTQQSSGARFEDTLKSPKPGFNLYLNKGNGSNVSINEHGLPPSTPRLRAHIGHLLPRHTYFRAKVTIHQISSVPFVSGEFGVRWKFKGVHTPTGQKSGLLDRVKARKSDKGKVRHDGTEDGSIARQNVGSISTSAPGMSDRAHSSVSSRSSQTESSQHLSVDWAVTNSTASTSNAASSNSSSTTTLAPTPISTNSDFSSLIHSASNINDSITPARGMTPFLKLKDHSVVWSQTLDTILKFDIDRETYQIMPNPLKLVVMQRVIPDDPHGSPQNPRLGAVYLNLAEYVGHGPVERRYLLKESKTNATLKVTIEIQYISGETHYIPPPLAKGEILTGLAGFLDNDAMKKRPRALDIYGPYNDQQELELDLLGIPATAKSAKFPKTPKTAKLTRNHSLAPVNASTNSDSDDEREEEYKYEDEGDSLDRGVDERVIAFDVQRLPFAYGTKTTEALIDALFNPVVISEKRQESPFTVYVPPLPSSPGVTPTPQKAEDTLGGIIGLGLTGVPVNTDDAHIHRPKPMKHRQESTSTSSVYSTSTSQSRSQSISQSQSSSSGSTPPESLTPTPVTTSILAASHTQQLVASPASRISTVDDLPSSHSTSTTNSSSGGVRGWWKRRTTKPDTPARSQMLKA